MTAIVGILCEDGIVVGSDSSSTFTDGERSTIEQKTKKIYIVENKVIIAGTGQVGLNQRFCGIVTEAYSNKIFMKPYLEVGRFLSEATNKNMASTACPRGQYGALLAYPNGGNYNLCEFAINDFQPEWKTLHNQFVSMGCGQRITDPFLGLMRRVFWTNTRPKVADATFIATWTLQHAIELNTGGINGPVQLSVLKHTRGNNFEARILDDAELQEHMNNVDQIYKYLGKYKDTFLGGENIPIPSA